MIIDALLQFDPNPTALANAVGTYNSTNVLDLHIIGGGIPVLAANQGARDIGIGGDPSLKLLVLVVTSFAGTTGTLQVNFQGAADNGAGAPAAYTTYLQTQAYALANLIAGARLIDQDVPRPPAGSTFPRFLRLQYVIGTAAMTAGAVTSDIVIDRHDQVEQTNAVLGGYPAGIYIAN